MNNKLAADFSVNKTNNTITVKRSFEAPLALVWDAYTKSEILDKWWAPKPWRAETKSMDFREGGHWHYAMIGPAGEKHWAWSDFTNVEPLKKFTGMDAFTDMDGNLNKELPQSKWEVSFTDKGAITLVTLHITYPDLAQLETTIQMGFKEGLLSAMGNLDDLFAAS